MRQPMWRRLFTAAVSAVALAGAAAAQNPTTLTPIGATQPGGVAIPQIPGGSPVLAAQPAPGPTTPTVYGPSTIAAAAGTPVVPLPGSVIVRGDGGCGTAGCGTTAPAGAGGRGFVMKATGGYLGTNCQFSRNCNNGCGSFKSDLGFFFGSCNSFFDPCGPRSLDCGLGRGCGKCLTPVYGRGSANGPYNPCVYDSTLSH